MGPSMSIDGVIRAMASGAVAGSASMGPSMSIDGVPRILSVRVAPHTRFNGAVDEHRRSHAGVVASDAGVFMLQWGRR